MMKRASTFIYGFVLALALCGGGLVAAGITQISYGSALPTNCANGNIFIKTSATVGPYWCSTPGSPGSWSSIGGISTPVSVANGGTNLTSATDDNVMVGNGTTWQSKALPSSCAGSSAKLLYDTSTNAFSCGTDAGASGAGNAGGSDKQVQYNNAGVLDGITNATAGYVLMSNGTSSVPSFQAPSGGGLTLLQTCTASSSATCDLTAISSTYDEYIVEGLQIVPATNATTLVMQVGTGAGPTWDTTGPYRWTRSYGAVGGAFGDSGSTGNCCGDTSGTIFVLMASAGFAEFTMKFKSQGSSFGKFFDVDGFQLASDGAFYHNGPAAIHYDPTTAITGLRYKMASGNIASGIFRLLGVPK